MSNEYQITLKLSETEFLAIARLGYRELRSPRNQARLLLRGVLIERGAISPNPSSELATKVTL